MQRTSRSLWRTGLILIGITLVFLLVSELCVRAGLWVYDFQPDYRTKSDAYAGQSWAVPYFNEDQRAPLEWQSYVYWRHQPFNGVYLNIDQNGHRSTFNVTDAERSRQIYFFGGSALWGVGVRDDYTIPSLVSRQLAEAGCRDVYVINYGEIGYVSTQEVVALLLSLRQRKPPAMVVFYDGVNDTWSALQNAQAGVPLNEFNRRAEFALESGQGLHWMLIKQLGMYRLAEILARRAATVIPNPVASNAELKQQVLASYEANARVVSSLAKEYGFVPYYFWQPVIFSKPKLSHWELGEVNKSGLGVREFIMDVYAAARRSEGLKALANFHDISGVFDPITETLFIDTWHTSERANAIIAKEIIEVLQGTLGCAPS